MIGLPPLLSEWDYGTTMALFRRLIPGMGRRLSIHLELKIKRATWLQAGITSRHPIEVEQSERIVGGVGFL